MPTIIKKAHIERKAKRFHVSLSFIQTLLGRYLDTKSIEPLPHKGPNASKIKDEHLETLHNLVAENNDATLKELCIQIKSKTQLKISHKQWEELYLRKASGRGQLC
jgi:transposase